MEILVTAAAPSGARRAVTVRPAAERFAPVDLAVPFAGRVVSVRAEGGEDFAEGHDSLRVAVAGQGPADRSDLPPPGEYAAV